MENDKTKVLENFAQELKLGNVYYKRPALEKLQITNQNLPVDFVSSKGTFKFFPYNSETIRDYGWGCAWRAIQSVVNTQFALENLNYTLNFEDLFNFFGQKGNLLAIYCQAFPQEIGSNKYKALLGTNFAPHDLSSGWAEPFIGQLCLIYFKMPCNRVALL